MRVSEKGDIPSSRYRNPLRLIVFLTALVLLLVGGGVLFLHVSRNPVMIPRKQDIPVPEPVTAGPRQKPAEKVAVPPNPQQTAGQKEAEQIEKASAFIASGNRHEQADDLTLARADYLSALRADPQSMKARKALNRVDRLISDNAFNQHMSSGLKALHNGNYYAAQDELIQAKKIKPDSAEVKDALAQVDSAIRLELIEGLNKEAHDAEMSENWKQALDSFRAVLKIDKTIRFAIRGEARAGSRLRLDNRLLYYLEKPRVLESDAFLNKATDVLETAQALEPKGNRLRAQIEKLEHLIQLAKTPVEVIITSDNLTEVTVYKVGKLGKIQAKALRLRPGTYTVVGIRNGYRDVRKSVAVKAQDRPHRITVMCEEEI